MNRILLASIFLMSLVCPYKNWKDQGLLSAVKTQGNCKAGWAFTATAIYESWFLYQNSSQYTNTTINFAEQFLLQCSSYGDCSGGSLADALSYAVQYGIPNETDFPYTGTFVAYGIPPTSSNNTCSSILSSTNKVNLTTYVNRYGNISTSQMLSLVNNFVVGVWLAADTGLYQYTSALNTTVPYNCTTPVTSDFQLNLPAVVVGYDDSRNLIVELPGRSAQGGTTYNATLQTGAGYMKISSEGGYCGAMRRVCQLWVNASGRNFNNTGGRMVVGGVIFVMTILMY